MITGFNWGQGTHHPKTQEFIGILAENGGVIGRKRADTLDRFIKDLHGISNPDYTTYDLWNSGKIVGLYPFIGGNANCHKWNLLDLRDDDSAYRLTFYGSPVHDMNGMNGLLNPSTYAATHLPIASLGQNSQHYAVWSNENDDQHCGAIGGAYVVGSSSGMYLVGGNDTMYGYVNNLQSSHPKSISSKRGFFMVKRGDASNLELIHDGYQESYANATDPLSIRSVDIGRFANGINNYVCSFACMGFHLTEDEGLFLSNAVTALNTAIRT